MRRALTNGKIVAALKNEAHIAQIEDIIRTRTAEIEAIPVTPPCKPDKRLLDELLHEDIRPEVSRILNVDTVRTPVVQDNPTCRYYRQNIGMCGVGMLAGSIIALGGGNILVFIGSSVVIGFSAMFAHESRALRREQLGARYQDEVPETGTDSHIYIGKRMPYAKRATLAHEETHAVQAESLQEMYKPKTMAFTEGMAIGIEREFLVEDCKEDVKGAQRLMETRLYSLIEAYRSLCVEMGRHRNAAIMEAHEQRKYQDTCIATYGLGDAMFSIAEAKHGPGIYAEALRDPRVVLE